jgi:hypothetical protein
MKSRCKKFFFNPKKSKKSWINFHNVMIRLRIAKKCRRLWKYVHAKKQSPASKTHKRDQMNGLNFFVRLNNISSLIIILILSRIIIKQKRLIAKKKKKWKKPVFLTK